MNFSGRSKLVISPGSPALSDPVDLAVANGAEISVSIYFPHRVTSVTLHGLALKQSVVSTRGDHTQDPAIQGGSRSDSSAFLVAVLVPEQAHHRVIAAVGDSIVDGDGSTPEKDLTWPNDLFRRLERLKNKTQYAIVNAGIAGNRLVSDGPLPSFGRSAVARYDNDVLSVAGLTDVIVLEGTNDIGFPGAALGDLKLAAVTDAPELQDIVGAYRQLIARAHIRGIRVIGCTIMPSEGVVISGYHSDAKEQLRQAVNHWIRTSQEFDALVDFDAVVRDPASPRRLLPSFSSDDHLHVNDAGYRVMADAIDLSLFE